MNEIMKEFEDMGKKDDFQSVVDNMMKQLLSKDIMYEPVVEITKRVSNRRLLTLVSSHPYSFCLCICVCDICSFCTQFPGWLASHKDGLSQEEYEKYVLNGS